MAGRIVRQGRLLTVLILTAAFLAPAVLHAQDVVVLPPTTDAAAAAPTPIPVIASPAMASSDAIPSALSVPQTGVPTMLPPAAPVAAAAVATVTLDPKFRQCASDADCVLTTDGCGSMEAVSKTYVANWQSATPRSADCTPAFDLAKAQQDMTAVCRSKTCGIQPKNFQ